jgi:hypothetical protein
MQVCQMFEVYRTQLQRTVDLYRRGSSNGVLPDPNAWNTTVSIPYRLEEARLEGMEDILYDNVDQASAERVQVGLPERREVAAV